MKKTFKLSVPYLGKAVVVTVVSFSCAISAYQLYQNSSIFSPQSQALDLKNNQVVFSNQNQQTNKVITRKNKRERDGKRGLLYTDDTRMLFGKKNTV